MLRKILLTVGLVALLATASLATVQTAQAQTPATVEVRFVHALVNGGEVDIYVNDSLVAPITGFGDATPHLRLPAGEHTIALREAGTDATAPVVFSQTVNLEPNRQGLRETLLVQQNANDAPEIAMTEDDVNPGQLGFARLHVVHAAADIGAVDLLGTNGAPIAQNISFNAPFGTVNPPVSKWELVFAPTGSTPDDALVAIGEISFNTGMLYTLILAGDSENPEAITLSTPLLAATDSDMVLARIAHGSTDAPAVDIYVNDETKILVNLKPGAITPHLALPAGPVELSVRAADSPANSEPVVTASVTLDSATGAASLVALGSVADDSFTFSIYEDDLSNLGTRTARLRVINTIASGPVTVSLSDGTMLAEDLATYSASDATDIFAGEFSITASVSTDDGELPLELPAQAFIGGTHYTLLLYANASAGLSTSPTAINLADDSLPGAMAGVVVAPPQEEEETPLAVVEPEEEETETPVAVETEPAVVVQQPDETAVQTQEPVVVPPVVVEVTPAPVNPNPVGGSPQQQQLDHKVRGTVNLNSGVSLHCREYPSPSAYSLGLIPNGTTLEVRGPAGPADPEVTTPFIPVEDSSIFDEPTDAEEWEEIWLSAYWFTADGGTIDCWVRADFLIMTYRNKLISEPQDLFDLIGLHEELLLPAPIIQVIPHNYPGDAVDTIVRPPTEVVQDPIATVNVDRGVNLHLRRTPDPNSESLALIPNGTALVIVEQTTAVTGIADDDPDDDLETIWLYVLYTDASNLVTSGWINAQYVVLSQGGRALALEDIPVADVVLPGEVVGLATPAAPAAPAEPVTTSVIGVVNIPQGSNLNMYDTPNINGTLVRSLGAGASIVVLGRNGDGSWLNVRYEVLGEGSWTGWVSNSGGWITLPVQVRDLPITNGDANTMP